MNTPPDIIEAQGGPVPFVRMVYRSREEPEWPTAEADWKQLLLF